MLLARGAAGDGGRARERLRGAIELAEALGMVSLAERARALIARPVKRPAVA